MKHFVPNKNECVIGFALFSLFFGAGNLILPPMLGFKGGAAWYWLVLGFALSAVVVPILGIVAHSKLQGTLFDFAKKVSPTFSLLYCVLIYLVSIALPSPRTASVLHEMAIAPVFGSPSWLTSTLYFVLVFLFVLNRSTILAIIGKVLTPALFIILILLIGLAIFGFELPFGEPHFENAFSAGLLEGYQTFDAIGSVVVGGVIIISINQRFKGSSYHKKKRLIAKGGLFAGLALFVIYGGLIFSGALLGADSEPTLSRTDLLRRLSEVTLGGWATPLLSVLVSLACFTTAVGIVTGASDFVKGISNNSHKAYVTTAVMASVLGVFMGQFNVGYIIAVALPALMFIYPLTIVLILLNVLPNRYAPSSVFRVVVGITIVFSVPDFMASLGYKTVSQQWFGWIPLSQFQMGWVLPAVLAFLITLIAWQRGETTS